MMPSQAGGVLLIQCQLLNLPPKNLSIRSLRGLAGGSRSLPVKFAYITKASCSGILFVSVKTREILCPGDKPARSGILPMNSARLVSAAAAALAALVVSGPKGESQTESAGAFSGSARRMLSTGLETNPYRAASFEGNALITL